MSEVLKISSKEEIKAVAKALASETRYNIAKLLTDKELSISKIAEEIGQTQANISAQIKYLEQARIIHSRYEPGDHGVRKICKTHIRQIIVEI